MCSMFCRVLLQVVAKSVLLGLSLSLGDLLMKGWSFRLVAAVCSSLHTLLVLFLFKLKLCHMVSDNPHLFR